MRVLVVFKELFQGLRKLLTTIPEFIIATINTVILVIVYFFFIGLTAATAKIIGKSFFTIQNKQAKSYWLDKKQTSVNMKEYQKQF